MKIAIAIAIAIAAFAASLSVPVVAADNPPGQSGGVSFAAQPMTDGLVRKVDGSSGRVTISHGRLPNGMPPMTMAFRLKEMAWAKQLKEGDRIRFAIDASDNLVRFEHVK